MITLSSLMFAQAAGVAQPAAIAINPWPATIVMVAMLTFLGIMMCIAHRKDGMDGAIKMWALLGSIVALLTGAAATFFFTNNAMAAAQTNSANALHLAQTASTLSADAQLIAAEASKTVAQQKLELSQQLETIYELRDELILKEDKLKELSTTNPGLGLKMDEIFIKPDLRDRLQRFDRSFSQPD